jgi:hypothetical protein
MLLDSSNFSFLSVSSQNVSMTWSNKNGFGSALSNYARIVKHHLLTYAALCFMPITVKIVLIWFKEISRNIQYERRKWSSIWLLAPHNKPKPE